jgi:hypothetical protein
MSQSMLSKKPFLFSLSGFLHQKSRPPWDKSVQTMAYHEEILSMNNDEPAID